jgi:hypothetical protein
MMQKTTILLSAALSLRFLLRFTDAAFSFAVAKHSEGKKNRAEFQAREGAEAEDALHVKYKRDVAIPKRCESTKRKGPTNEKLCRRRRISGASNKKNEKDYDPLTDWKKLRAEGKIKVGSDLERDESSRRLGSDGLVSVRTDELLPYIDQGYVDEDADVMGNFMKMFGGGKKKQDE